MRKLIALTMAVLLILAAMACGASDEDLQAEYDRGYTGRARLRQWLWNRRRRLKLQ